MADNKHIIEVSVFDAGLNTKAEPINLPPGQSPDLKNVVFDDYGSVSLRPGIKTFNSGILSGSLDGLYGVMALASYKPSTMSALLACVTNRTLYICTGAATTPVSVPSSSGQLATNQYVETAQFQELLFLVSNGPDEGPYQPYKFNGREFTRMGVSAPTQVLTAVCDAAGSLTGTYRYVYWGVNSYSAEGDYIATPSTAAVIASGNIRVNNIPTAPVSHGINTWKVGRNTADAAGVYWYLTDVTNGTTSFTDTVADASLIELAPADQGYPRQFQFITAYGGRVWGSIEDYLWYSNINQPEEFPSENFIRVGRGDGMDISAISPFMGMIVISKSNNKGQTALYSLAIGDSVTFADPESWYLKFVANGVGSESHRGVISFSNYLMLPNRYGVHLFDGSSIALAASESSSGAIASENIANVVSDRFKMSLPAAVTVPMKAAAAINWGGRALLSHARDTDREYQNSQVMAYDYQRVGGRGARNGSWTEFPSVAASQFAIHEGKLFGGSPRLGSPVDEAMEGGYIYEWDNGEQYQNFLDFGAVMSAYYVASPFHGASGHEGHNKDFRWVIFSEKGGASGGGANNPAVTATFYVDGSSLATATLIHTETYSIGTSGRDYKIFLPAVASGKRLWIKYSWAGPNNTYLPPSAACKLSRMKICYTLRGLRNA